MEIGDTVVVLKDAQCAMCEPGELGKVVSIFSWGNTITSVIIVRFTNPDRLVEFNENSNWLRVVKGD